MGVLDGIINVFEEGLRLFVDNIISGIVISVVTAVIAASSIGGLAGIMLNTIPTVMRVTDSLKTILIIVGAVLFILSMY